MSRAFRVGVFTVGTLAILAAGIFLIGDKQFLFSSTYRVKAAFHTVSGLNNGAEVRVGGIHKGTVRQIQLPSQPDGGMTVVMDLERSTRDVIKVDSIAAIHTEGLLGNKFVEISFGSDSAPAIRDGDTIASVPPLDISDLMKKADEIMNSTKESTESLAQISSKINEGTGTVGALVNDRKVYEQLNAATAQAKAGATAFQENMTALKHNWFLRGFFNKRGYEDSTELTAYEIAFLPEKPYNRKLVYDSNNIFDGEESAKLKSGKPLNEAGRLLESTPFGLAVIVAYNGMKGDSKETLVLTQARALNARDYLVKNFRMDDTRVKTMGLGKREQNGAGETGKIEILIYPAGTNIIPRTQSAETPPAPPPHNVSANR